MNVSAGAVSWLNPGSATNSAQFTVVVYTLNCFPDTVNSITGGKDSSIIYQSASTANLDFKSEDVGSPSPVILLATAFTELL
jgi:hypothetical protein